MGDNRKLNHMKHNILYNFDGGKVTLDQAYDLIIWRKIKRISHANSITYDEAARMIAKSYEPTSERMLTVKYTEKCEWEIIEN